ncbi:MAG: hypothetical protein IT373_18380 [Polyangiaceae bacterium]|nr:hypothetical protein [Polyangiaceae bacterium]
MVVRALALVGVTAGLLGCGGPARDGKARSSARADDSPGAPASASAPTPAGSVADGGVARAPVRRPRGIYAVVEWSEPPGDATWSNPRVDGVVVRAYWRDLNPQKDVYRWDLFDAAVQAAARHGKKARFIVVPGFYAPDFVLQDAAVQQVTFTVPQGPLAAEARPLPLPWDDAYLGAWYAFVDRLAERYRDDPSFAYISATGPNSHNGEVSLPREPSDEKIWQSLGSVAELERRMLGAWSRTFEHFCGAFRGKHFTVAIISEALPGQKSDEQKRYQAALAKLGAEACPDGFGLQNNGLDGRPVQLDLRPLPAWDLIESYGGKIFTAFQTRMRANLYKCKRTGRECEGEKRDIFAQTLKNGLSRHASVLEIYERDLADPELAPLLADAHAELQGAR